MSDLDKEFNKRFQYKKSASDDAELENLWNAVESELDEESSERPFFYFLPRFLGAFLLLSLLAGTVYWIGLADGQKVLIDNNAIDKNVISRKNESKDICLEFPTREEFESNTMDANDVSEKKDFSSITDEKSLVTANNTESEFAENLNDKKESTYSGNILLTTIKEQRPTLNSSSIEENEQGVLVTVDDNKLPNVKPTSSPLIETKKFGVKHNEPEFFDLLLPQPKSVKKEAKKETKPKDINFALGVNGGVNWNNQNYKGAPTFGSLRNSAESGDYGQSYGVEAIMTLNDHWIIQTGFEYHKFWSKFDYLNTQTEQVLKENQLTKVWLNGSDTLRTEYNDVFVNRTSTREVLHHNQYNQLSIPLEFGFKNRTGKLSYGLTLGTSFNFIFNQSGKSFDELLDITEYDNNSVAKPLNDFNIGLRVNPFVGYHVSEKLMLGLKPNLMLQHHGGVMETDLSMNVQQFGLKLGLQFGF